MHNNDIDANVDDQISECLDLDSPKSFFLFAGAGSGKTRSLVNVLGRFKQQFGHELRLTRRKVAIITYTNAASDEIVHRLEYDPIFSVSTIHSFSWELIRNLTEEIRQWLLLNLRAEITELEAAQLKSRDLNNKTSIDRARKIESKTKRIAYLPGILKFTYNPNGDNIQKDSLNHTEVISITGYLIRTEPLMRAIVICRFPIILVDESQDTKKELIDALFELQSANKKKFSLGLFGDTMQRIYSDGKENLGIQLPEDWVLPQKVMNHRSNKRIIKLVNDIRKFVDDKEQFPRTEKPEGLVRFFILNRGLPKKETEQQIANKMSELTKDSQWDFQTGDVKILILEHHMAAQRMGFFDFFEPLYGQDKIKTALLDGSLAGANFFTRIIVPLIEASQNDDKFSAARIVKEHSRLLARDELIKAQQQVDNITKANKALSGLLSLWENGQDPSLISILQNVYNSQLFSIPDVFYPLVARSKEETDLINNQKDEEEEGNDAPDGILNAWERALVCSYSQVAKYAQYLDKNSKFGTHQGVKGLEYPRVMVIIDDEESKGFLFAYDKLFGAKELSTGDRKHISEGKETSIDKTRRLFYVACSRAKESLAIVAYTDSPETVKQNVLGYKWFSADEVEIID